MKKFLCLLLAGIILFSLSGCSEAFDDFSFTSSSDFDFGISSYSEYNYSSEAESKAENSYFSSSSRYNYSSNRYSGIQSSSQDTPTFYSLTTLSKYLNEQKNKGVLKITFKYSGTEEPDPQMLAQMVSAFFVTDTVVGDKHTLNITEYPGDRIVDAYRSGNRALLTSDEKKAMDKAIQMVSTAKAKAKNNWELELLIHDMLADNINYYNDAAVDFDKLTDAPRYISIVGALLDKKANCQGYSDAFYTLASMAGFTVSRMNVETPDDLHVTNTISLNGRWYVVDVTFDDQGSNAPTNHRLFTAGLDCINEYSWKPWKEINPIAAMSGVDYYYNNKGISFYTMKSFAEYTVNKWLAGEKTIDGMVRNQKNGDAIEGELSKALENTGKAYNYTYWYYEDSKNLYYTIQFK